MSDFLYIIGVIVLGLGLRTFGHPVPRKLGMIAFFGASFLIGFFVSGNSWGGGLISLSVWFLLPWLEILTRIRKLRLPTRKSIDSRFPPTRTEFPQVHEVSTEIANAGFRQMNNVGWQDDQSRQFFRIFHRDEDHTTATLCLHEQAGHAILFVSLSSRTEDGRLFRTWNYPFSYSMVMPPNQHTLRAAEARSFNELIDRHIEFLDDNLVTSEQIVTPADDEFPRQLEIEFSEQVDHNLDRGIIRPAGEGFFRYSPRGLFFLWAQFVKDLVKLG
ncbi:hypothetical protein [Sulfuriroseicoccus oceanibius]|uniref:Uncharacterized protein n=1 Tax=Sulfuriroseicoccus oceanibius TaxID=2707525 RepID=A0A6B3LA29_9BACT|nr:hypothetical protein [Sulfuriroseicoccus oceanibius]QQL45592.1 hypothetical protein G3M56_003105 [Sulfuriroseicoccus oceanibius]